MITHIFVESGIKYCVSRQNSGRFSDDYPYWFNSLVWARYFQYIDEVII
jgi:hypothetical protein